MPFITLDHYQIRNLFILLENVSLKIACTEIQTNYGSEISVFIQQCKLLWKKCQSIKIFKRKTQLQ